MNQSDTSSVLIIGGSRGIGLALVEHYLAKQSKPSVIAAARQAQSHPKLQALQQQYPDKLRLINIDVADEASVISAAEVLAAQSLETLIHTTGLLHDQTLGIKPEKRFEDISPAQLETVMRINAFGSALLLKHMLPKMAKDHRAVFAAISARVGSIEDNRIGGWYAYRASKAALNQILKTASIEAKRRYPSLIIAALHPGTTDTDLSKPFQANVPPEKLFTAQFVAKRLAQVIEDLTPEDSGGFFAWDGQAIPY